MGYATPNQLFEHAMRREIPKILGPLWSDVEIHIVPNHMNDTKFYAFRGKLNGKVITTRIELDEIRLTLAPDPYRLVADQIFEAAKDMSYTERPAARFIKE